MTLGAIAARSWDVVQSRAWSLGRGMTPPGRGNTAGLIPTPSDWGNPAGPFVWGPESARRIPSVARCLGLYGGLVKQMKMRAYRSGQALPQPPLLDAPDPTRGGPWFVQCSVEDYLLSGNAISYVTSRGADGWPLSMVWLPAPSVSIMWTPPDFNDVDYFYLGAKLRTDDVIHVRRGADRYYPVRGVGVVEDALATLNRIAAEEEYEAGALASSAVPSVAIIAPGTLTQETATAAKSSWMDTFAGPIREPVILPTGTVVQPLAWSPSDTQLTEARHMSLTDVANLFNLDAYWVSGPAVGLTYKNPSPAIPADPAHLPRAGAGRLRAGVVRRLAAPGHDGAVRPGAAAAGGSGHHRHRRVALVGAGIWSKPEARDALDMSDPNNVPKPPKPSGPAVLPPRRHHRRRRTPGRSRPP